MAKVTIPTDLLQRLGPEMKMDTHWIDVKLRNGAVRSNLVVRGGRYITGAATDLNGEGMLDFSTDDIVQLRRRHPLGRCWPFWG